MKRVTFIFLTVLCVGLCACKRGITQNNNGINMVMEETTEYETQYVETTTTEVQTEATAGITEPVTQQLESVARQTEAVTQIETVSPTEVPTIKPTEAPTMNHTETPTIKPTETATMTPADSSHLNRIINCTNGDIVIDAEVTGINATTVNTYDYRIQEYSEAEALSMLNEFVGHDIATTFTEIYEWWKGGEQECMSMRFDNGFRLTIGWLCSDKNPYLGNHNGVYAPGCSMSVDECGSIADSIVKKYVTNEYIAIGREIFDQENVHNQYTRTGHYEFKYKKLIDGISIYNSNTRSEDDIKISMIDNTVIEINIANYILNYRESYSYISVDEAIKKIEEQIGLYGSDFLPGNITKIKLEYFIPLGMRDENYTPVFEPVWHFYAETRMINDIIVNAITGEVTIF